MEPLAIFEARGFDTAEIPSFETIWVYPNKFRRIDLIKILFSEQTTVYEFFYHLTSIPPVIKQLPLLKIYLAHNPCSSRWTKGNMIKCAVLVALVAAMYQFYLST